MAKRSYAGSWLLLLCSAAAAAGWVLEGDAYVRRHCFSAPPVPESARTASQFVAVLFPRITSGGEKFTMSYADLELILGTLAARGYHPVSLGEVRDLYAGRRLLPSRAILLAFDKDYPSSAVLGDRALRRARMRGVFFVHRVAGSGSVEERKFLSAHAVRQMVKGGAWEFGWALPAEDPALRGPFEPLACLREAPGMGARSFPLEFEPSEAGHNDRGDDPRSLRMVSLSTERDAAENLRVIEGSWPRASEFEDRFQEPRLSSDWIVGWGVAATGKGRLALLPTPRHTGAAIRLRGTEKWRDAAVEFVLNKYQKEFSAYARYEEGRYVRVGIRDGSWYVEQKVSADSLPSVLARVPAAQAALPARVRLTVKGGWALLYVNGRLQFGRALRVHPRVARGSVVLGAYDAAQGTALALVRSVKAEPLGREWVALRRSSGVSEEAFLAGLRSAAARAAGISPAWLEVRRDASVLVAGEQRELVTALAGFYRCALAPMADLSGPRLALLEDPRAVERLAAGLRDGAAALDASGVNVRLKGWRGHREATLRFLWRLRGELRQQRRSLWVTVDAAGPQERALAAAADAVLATDDEEKEVPGLELLRRADPIP
ncbi:MAG TPA: hypothetical protein VNI01_01550 [Elusimicrobiota bacterium]|jgi:hypothetical protein|nr:hypothetical protein [Elusimicrobiota bacterium]